MPSPAKIDYTTGLHFTGRQMQVMSNSLPTEEDLDDVIAYIHSLATE